MGMMPTILERRRSRVGYSIEGWGDLISLTGWQQRKSVRTIATWLAELPQGLSLDISTSKCYPADHPVFTPGQASAVTERTNSGLSYADDTFDLVTWLDCAHLHDDVAGMMAEAARVVKPGGTLVASDLVTDPEPKIARAVNSIEGFVDRRHKWAYSLPDWEVFFHLAGITVSQVSISEERLDLDVWGVSAGLDDRNLLRLRALILNGPATVKAALKPEKRGNSVVISRHEIALLGRKSI